MIFTSALEDQARKNATLLSHSYSGQFCVRKGGWKLIFPQKLKDEYVLYDLNQDPKESNNVAQKYPEIIQELSASLKKQVNNGRSTPGAKQNNYRSETTWPELPWYNAQ